MQDPVARWGRTLLWIGLGGNVVLLLLAAIFSMPPHVYPLLFSSVLFGTSHVVHPTRPRLAIVCTVLGWVALIASIVLGIRWITR